MKIDSSIFNLFAQRPRKAPVAETSPGATTPVRVMRPLSTRSAPSTTSGAVIA